MLFSCIDFMLTTAASFSINYAAASGRSLQPVPFTQGFDLRFDRS